MQKLKIAPTKTTFGINFDPKKSVMEFTGNSYPPNPMDFFQPLIDWAKNFLFKNPDKPVTLVFKVHYYNTTSSKYIFRILELLHEHHKKHDNINIVWHDNGQDDEFYDTWKSLLYELDLPHEVIQSTNS